MILNKIERLKSGEAVVLKLNSGVEVIGQVKSVDTGATTLIIEKVRECHIRPVQASPGQPPQMQLDINMPYVFLDQDCEVYVLFQDIQAVPLVPADLEKHYLSTVSGIEIPR